MLVAAPQKGFMILLIKPVIKEKVFNV